MKNKKGFTLIELLAVIVILAIIALITVPTVLNIIDKAKKGAAVDSAYGVEKAADFYYLGNVGNSNFAETTFTCNGTDCASNLDSNVKLDIGGTVPTSGTIIVRRNGKVEVSNLVINGYNCTKTNEVYNCGGEVIEPKPVITAINPTNNITYGSSNTLISYFDTSATTGAAIETTLCKDGNDTVYTNTSELPIGTHTITCTVTKTTGQYASATTEIIVSAITYPAYSVGNTVTVAGTSWYVIENSDINTSTVKLLRVTCSTKSQYHASSDVYATSTIKGVVESYGASLNLGDDLIEPARLITVDELNSLGCNSGSYTCSGASSWVYTSGQSWYWTMTPYPGRFVNAYYVEVSNLLSGNGVSNSGGVRPVIVVNKSAIQ